MPEITPPPASLLRQVAYSQAVRIPGPAADPLGWYELSPAANIFGKLSNGKPAKLQCSVCAYCTILHNMMLILPFFQLSLANPVSYFPVTVKDLSCLILFL